MAIDFIEDAPSGLDFQPDPEPASPEKLSLQAEMEKLRSERERGDLMESALGGAESIVERLTPAGILNQPARLLGYADPYQQGTPAVDLPEPSGTGFMSGVGQLASRTAEALTTPESLLTLPFAGVAPIRALFAGQMAQHLPEQIAQGGEVLRDPNATTAEKVVAAGSPLVTAALTRAAGRTGQWLPDPLRPELDIPPNFPTRFPTPIRELGIRVPEGPFAQPGIAELADAALREKMSLVKDPRAMGAELNELRRAMNPPVIEPATIALAERIEGGGEAPYGRVSYQREAEAPLPERTQEALAIQPEKPVTLEPTEKRIGRVFEHDGKQFEIVVKETSVPGLIRVVGVHRTDVPRAEGGAGRTDLMNAIGPSGIKSAMREVLNEFPNANEIEFYRASKEGQRRYVRMPIPETEKPPAAITEGGEQVVPPKPASEIPAETGAVTAAPEQAAIREATTETPLAQELQPTKGIITGRAIEKWADDTLRGGATHLGPDVLAAYMVKGAALIERGVINFAEWSARMIEEHGPKIEPHLKVLFAAAQATVKRDPVGESGTLKSSREIVEQRIRQMTEGEDVKMRKSAARATESPAIPEPVQERIATSPESFYKVQPNELVEQAVKRMSDTDLMSVPADSNLFVASRLEAANRLFNAGNMEGGYRVFEELEKQGTSFGQNINQFKRLPGTLPEHTAFVINQKLKNSGKDPLTERQEADVIQRTKVSKKADSDLDVATEAWRKNPTEENARLAQEALKNAENAAINLQRFMSRYEPKSTASILKSILQGNLLTPISQTANLFGNISFLPFRALDRTVASGMDIIDNYLSGRPREISAAPIGGTAASVRGAIEGAKKIPEVLFRGTGDTIKGETRAGLHPVEAWINQFSKNPEMPTTGGKLTLKDRANLVLEGTLGVPAEMMLRGLGAGDVPFKEAARSRVITEQLRLHKVPQSQWSMARKFPELFFDRKTMEQIQGDTLQAVFQRNSKTIGHLMNWIRGRGDTFDLAVATVAPYKLTPWNLVSEILSYNPVVAFARSAYDVSKGNSRSAKLNAGKLYVGTMLTAAGWWLYQNGLLAPSLDERTEAQKARVLSDEVLPPNHINISGLERKLKGGDPAFQPGDRTVDIFRAGGLAGSMFYMAANIGRGLEKQPESGSMDQIGALVRQSILEQARFGLNQSFLSGVEGLLTAVKDGNTDSYVRQYMNTVLSIPFPNSLATLSRATRENQPEFRAEGFTKQVENTIRNKLGFAGLDDYLPLKRGLWGEPLPQTPKGANALFYHFFDISKNRQVTDDPVPIELYRLWRSTADTRAIPSLPENTLTREGTTYTLTPEQRSHYAELVGKYRRQIVDAMVINPEFQKLSNEGKLDKLDSAYRIGMKIGKEQFWNETKSALQPKGARAGFNPTP